MFVVGRRKTGVGQNSTAPPAALMGEIPPKDARIAPLNLPHPAGLSSDSSHSPAMLWNGI